MIILFVKVDTAKIQMSSSPKTKEPQQEPILGLSVEDQWNIINQTGVLHKINKPSTQPDQYNLRKRNTPVTKQKIEEIGSDEDDVESVVESDLEEDFEDDEQLEIEPMPLWAEMILISTPLSILHALFEYIVHIQYGFKEEYSMFRLVRRSVPIFFLLSALTWATNRIKVPYLMQTIFAIAGSASGVYLIKQTLESDKTFGSMMKTPGIAILWIYLVIQMKVLPAVICLVVPLLYYMKDYGAK
ncbi:hypothetical protein HK098_001346 [Nowakowskiella sp. JEL0407]|nr:hypothetical protein HK098_001346 [Nowakowskiella sp. JEL0407]